MKIAFIGLGLMGGSIAKALKKSNPSNQIIAIDRDEASLKAALDLNVIDYGSGVIDENLSSCDVIFLCAPVNNNASMLADIAKYIKKDAILTDIGSVKKPIHEFVKEAGLVEYFVGGHPMAGSEKSGFINSSEILLENAFYILTTDDKDEKRLNVMTKLIDDIGAIPIHLNPSEHDLYTAGISHLPHLVAAALVELVRENDGPEEYMRLIAAGGFKDITRIASSNPTMWQQICDENADNIHILLNKYIDLLKKIDEKLLSDNDYIYELFDVAGNYRLSFSDVSNGPIKKLSCLYCDIADESGAIANVATIMAKANISLKNIGIINSREFEDGVLRLEFADEALKKSAEDILRKNNYTVHVR